MNTVVFNGRYARWLCDDTGDPRKSRVALVLSGFYVLFAATYLPINEFSVGRDAHTLYLPGEERIPFLPIFDYLYVLTYVLPWVLIFTIRNHATLWRLKYAVCLTLLVAYTTYLLFPVYLERPHLEVNSLHTWLLSLSYLDKSYNHFPSLHVAFSWLVVLASEVSRGKRVGLAVVAAGISISTVFVKQHYIADVLYGGGLAWFAWKLAGGAGASKRWIPATGAAATSAAE